MDKIVVYQIFVRLFGNMKTMMTYSGTITENGVGKMNDISEKALLELAKMGISHIWLTGILEHATTTAYPGIPADLPDIVKGRAGSPYAIRDYYDVDPDLAVSVENRMQEFENLIDRIHHAGMKVWIDFVPNHVSRNYHSDNKPKNVEDFGENDDVSQAFSPKNNFYYLIGKQLHMPEDLHPFGKQIPFDNTCITFNESPAKVTGNDCFSETPSVNDWYETVKLNYGVDYLNGKTSYFFPIPDTWNKMVDILLFWCSKGVDGFRCDMAEMVPVEFWRYAIHEAKATFPKTTFVAEIYNEIAYRSYVFYGGFDFIYDKIGFYDTLRNIITSSVSTQAITTCWQRLQGLDRYMLRFMENHDEQRIASNFFAGNPWKAIPAMMLAATMNTGPVMLYFAQETGEAAQETSGFSADDGRTTIFDYFNVPSYQRWTNHGAFDGAQLAENEKQLRKTYRRILQFCRKETSVRTGAFFDLMWVNPQISRQYCYLRYTEKRRLLFCLNFNEHSAEMTLIIPKETFSAIGISAQSLIFKPIFTTSEKIGCKAVKIDKNTVSIILEGLESVVYEIIPC